MNSSIQEKSVVLSYVAILLMPREFDAQSRVMHLSSKRDLIESTNRKLEMEKIGTYLRIFYCLAFNKH